MPGWCCRSTEDAAAVGATTGDRAAAEVGSGTGSRSKRAASVGAPDESNARKSSMLVPLKSATPPDLKPESAEVRTP